jgi:hypothetical protein
LTASRLACTRRPEYNARFPRLQSAKAWADPSSPFFLPERFFLTS